MEQTNIVSIQNTVYSNKRSTLIQLSYKDKEVKPKDQKPLTNTFQQNEDFSVFKTIQSHVRGPKMLSLFDIYMRNSLNLILTKDEDRKKK